LWLVFDARGAVELLQQFALALVQLGWSLNAKLDEQIPLAVAIQHGHAFAANTHGGARLHALRHFQRMFILQGGDANLGAERGLSKGNRNHTVQIGAFALEKRMLLHMQNHIQIAGGPAECAGFPESGKTDAGAVFDAGGNLRVDGLVVKDASFTFAFGAGIGDDAARALTSGTGAGHAEESLLVANLAASAARAAGGRSFAGRGAVALAVLTDFVAAHRDLRFLAEDRFFEFEGYVFAQVGTTLGAAAAATASAEQIPKAEEVAEDFAEVLHYVGVKTAGATVDAGVAETVVGGTFVGVGQDGVGLAAFLEFFFCVGIIGIAIRMELQRQLAIGALDFLLAGFAGNPEYFVVVAFYVAGQSGLS